MPPKAKFTEEEVISAALDIVREGGMSALTARSLAKALKSSPRPIFTTFKSMEEVAQKTEAAAREIYNTAIGVALDSPLPFKCVGSAYIQFAKEEPKLFQLLFMSEFNKVPDRSHVLNFLDDSNGKIINCVQNDYGLSRESAMELYLHLWIYTHGIASLIATHVCTFSAEEISEMLTVACKGILKEMKAEGKV